MNSGARFSLCRLRRKVLQDEVVHRQRVDTAAFMKLVRAVCCRVMVLMQAAESPLMLCRAPICCMVVSVQHPVVTSSKPDQLACAAELTSRSQVEQDAHETSR